MRLRLTAVMCRLQVVRCQSPTPDTRNSKCSIQEFPGICSIEAPDDHRGQKLGLEVPQVHAVASARQGFNGFPVGDDPAGLAPEGSQGSVAPDVAFRVFRMALYRDRAKFVISPYAACAPT